MIAIPIADILNYRRAKKNKEASVFDYSGPIVQYVAVVPFVTIDA